MDEQYDYSMQSPRMRKKGGRGPGKKENKDKTGVSVRWEEGELTDRLIELLHTNDLWAGVFIATSTAEHSRAVIGMPKSDLQREIARELFRYDHRFDITDQKTIDLLGTSVKNKVNKIRKLYNECKEELGAAASSIGAAGPGGINEDDLSPDTELGQTWARVKEKLPQYIQVRDIMNRPVVSSQGQVIDPSSSSGLGVGGLGGGGGEGSSSGLGMGGMGLQGFRGAGRSVSTPFPMESPGLNYESPILSPLQPGHSNGGRIQSSSSHHAHHQPGGTHLHQHAQPPLHTSHSSHHLGGGGGGGATTTNTTTTSNSPHTHPHSHPQLPPQHHAQAYRNYYTPAPQPAPPRTTYTHPTTALGGGGGGYPGLANHATSTPALGLDPQTATPIAGPSGASGALTMFGGLGPTGLTSATNTVGMGPPMGGPNPAPLHIPAYNPLGRGKSHGPGSQGPRSPDPLAVDDVRPLSRSSSRDSPDPPSSPPLTATLFQMFRALESRKRQREEEYVSLKRMKLEHREMQKQREERERERWHEREMLRLQIQLEQYKREDPTAGAALASAVGGGPVGLGVGVGDDHDESTPIAGPSHTLALTQAHGGASSQPPQQQPSDIPHSALTQHGTHLAHLGVGVGAAHLESHERAASGGPGSTAGGGGGGGDDSSQQNPIHTPQPQSQSHSHHPRLSTLDVGHHSHIPHHLIESLGSAGGPQSAAPLNPPGSAVQSALMSPGNAALDALTSLREGTGSGGLR